MKKLLKFSDAVKLEVTTFAKHIIGTIAICEQIKNGFQIPAQDAKNITKGLYDAVIYPAVADKIGLLPHPEATVEFYMRIAEAKAMADMLQARTSLPAPPSATNVTTYPSFVTQKNAQSIADSLITSLQLARSIIADTVDVSEKTQLKTLVPQIILNQINDCLNSAKVSFPDAESFKNKS